LEHCRQAKARDLPMFGGRSPCLGNRVVGHALAHRGQDLIRASARSRNEKNMPEAGLVAAVLISELRKHIFIRSPNAALLAL
jgi:hypothetical protein